MVATTSSRWRRRNGARPGRPGALVVSVAVPCVSVPQWSPAWSAGSTSASSRARRSEMASRNGARPGRPGARRMVATTSSRWRRRNGARPGRPGARRMVATTSSRWRRRNGARPGRSGALVDRLDAWLDHNGPQWSPAWSAGSTAGREATSHPRGRRNGARPGRPGALLEGDHALVDGLAAMEPGLVGREHMPVATPSGAKRRMPQWSPAWSAGSTGGLEGTALDEGAAMEPGLVGRSTPGHSAGPLNDLGAAMEPGLVGREHPPSGRARCLSMAPQWSPAWSAGSTPPQRWSARRTRGRNGARPGRPGAPGPCSTAPGPCWPQWSPAWSAGSTSRR